MIQTEHELAALLPKIHGSGWIAVDTEADSLHAYPEKLCLLQISTPDTHALVDPLFGGNLAPLLEAVRPKTLLLHGADYDLRLLHRTYQFVPSKIFNTMWAARLLGYREFGLQSLVKHHLGVALEKGPQKMNWAMRPLPDRMAIYALNDTRFLHPLAEILRADLKAAGRLTWLEEVCSTLIMECSSARAPDPDSLWRIKGSDRLPPQSMAVLRELWLWREEEAIAANKPPYFILSHERLVALSAAASQGRPAKPLLPNHVPAKRAARLLEAVERGLRVPASKYPRPRRPKGIRLTRPQQTTFDTLRKLRDERAADLGLDASILASKADLVQVAKGLENGGLMTWQRELLKLK
ncbi:MAG: ribonuclease D [Verrucomicrobiia bacterium]